MDSSVPFDSNDSARKSVRSHHAFALVTGAAAKKPVVRSNKSASLTEAALSKAAGSTAQQAQLKPLSDVLAGALARAASQSTIHPLDTIKVRIQANKPRGPAPVIEANAMSKFGQLVPPPNAMSPIDNLKSMGTQVASLYKGVLGAASGAGIAIGAYFAFYSTAHNLLVKHTNLTGSSAAFVAGGTAAFGSSVIKVPIAVCIRNVQAGNFKNAFEAARSIIKDHGVKGLYRGWVPSVVEDMPDMAFKFACYETLRSVHRNVTGRGATPQEDFAIGAVAGAFAAAATTPFDVIKTRMAVSTTPMTMQQAIKVTVAEGGVKPFFRGVGPRALSNGINSAVFFVFFEALSKTFKEKAKLQQAMDARRSKVMAVVESEATSALA